MALSHKPRLGLDVGILSPLSSCSVGLVSRPQYSHVSNFCSLLLSMQLYSSSIKMVKRAAFDGTISCPVFGDNNDRVEGRIILDPTCSQTGRLIISMEGVFEYISLDENSDDGPKTSKHRNIFLASSVIVPISPIPDSRSAFRARKRLDHSNLNSPAPRSCEFSFEIPRGSPFGEEMPPTFSSSLPGVKGRSNLSPAEKAEVSYRITAVWEPSDKSENRGILEAPIFFHPDSDFQSMDCSDVEPESWDEMPLIPERSIPFRCAVTLPRPRTFSRSNSISFFVVFTTKPRCSVLIGEIAADATISVSLIRKLIINPQPLLTPLDSNDDSDGSSSSPPTPRVKLLKRVPKPGVFRASRTPEEPFEASAKYKPIPDIPQASFSTTRILKTQMQIGFPKRPRNTGSQESQAHMPDGLYKGRIQLSKDMIPGVEWSGASIKYYLDVTVLFGGDASRACIPIRII